MTFENISDASELVHLCKSDSSIIKTLTKEELHTLINFLIENSDSEVDDRLVEQCLMRLDEFDGYSDSFDKAKVLSGIICTTNIIIKRSRLMKLKRFSLTAAVLITGVIFLFPLNAISRQSHFEFNFDDIKSNHVSEITDADKSYTSLRKFRKEYPHIMIPSSASEEFSFIKADIFSDDETLIVSFYSSESGILEYTVADADSEKLAVPAEHSSDNCTDTVIDSITYHVAEYNEKHFLFFSTDNDRICILSAFDSDMSSEELIKAALSFE